MAYSCGFIIESMQNGKDHSLAHTHARMHPRGARERSIVQLASHPFNKHFLNFLSTLGRLVHPTSCTSWNFPCTAHDLPGSGQKSSKATKAATVKTSVPKECPQSWPCDEEYSMQPALSSRGGQGAPPFIGSCCTERLRTRVVGWQRPAQPLHGLHSPTKQGRAGKQNNRLT